MWRWCIGSNMVFWCSGHTYCDTNNYIHINLFTLHLVKMSAFFIPPLYMNLQLLKTGFILERITSPGRSNAQNNSECCDAIEFYFSVIKTPHLNSRTRFFPVLPIFPQKIGWQLITFCNQPLMLCSRGKYHVTYPWYSLRVQNVHNMNPKNVKHDYVRKSRQMAAWGKNCIQYWHIQYLPLSFTNLKRLIIIN